ncbi:Putative peptidoglycan binding domain-containing protein [Paramicrobacterium humi]|uniref:Putative peptidoglycan binding domain-containing protein n=1 Tax=Paramicrobacterium humi TaxID=640635 RepID=A0A1H4J806_9MICO|nr:L,D-transpeptidase family protein [Microbacterium humi]SEB41778.1 Putative peptidoglycan binding domain-containing protein [Microbacterium humi]
MTKKGAVAPGRGRRLGLWFGIPGGLIVAGAAACSVLLIAPGVSAAGADLSWHTSSSAADAIANKLASTEITISGYSGDFTLTGAELGVAIDESATADAVHSEHALWNVTGWNNGPSPVTVTIDADRALASLRSLDSTVFTTPVNADVAYDEKAGKFTVVDAFVGTGLDFSAIAASLSEDLSAGESTISVPARFNDVEPPITTEKATAEAAMLNTLITDARFAVNDDTAVALDPKLVASWLTVDATEDDFTVTADEDAIAAFVKTLPEKVDRKVVDEKIVTNSKGDHLRTVQEGEDGWTLASTDGIASAFAEQLAAGNGVYQLTVDVVPAQTKELYRHIEVDKSAGKTILYENGKVVATYAVAIGKPSTPTDIGHFTVYGQLTKQDMGCVPGFDYCTKNVPWVTYFNGDQGFHGTYWHHNFGAGAMMSHGCVNMTIAAAKDVYYFAQTGTEVWVHP